MGSSLHGTPRRIKTFGFANLNVFWPENGYCFAAASIIIWRRVKAWYFQGSVLGGWLLEGMSSLEEAGGAET